MENFHPFETRPALAQALARDVAAALTAAIETRGAASLAVSGGSTPKLFFEALSAKALFWDKVTVTLVDERFVPPESDRSNHRLVAENLLQNKAKAAYFVPLFQPAASPEDAATLATVKTEAICDPFDVVILGMGTDGHTASFFPGGDNLYEALDVDSSRLHMSPPLSLVAHSHQNQLWHLQHEPAHQRAPSHEQPLRA